MRGAEASIPRRTELYDLYEDILLDAHLRSVIEKRIMAITNADWTFIDANGKEVDEINKFIDTPEFETLLTEIIQSKLWGYSMIEFDFHQDGTIGVFNIPRKHIRPGLGLITFEQTGDTGIDIRTGVYANTILEVGKEKDLGLLLSAAQYVIYKRGNFGDWAQFAEVFGMPLIDAVWDGFDEKQRVLLEESLNNMGGGGQIVRPAGTQLQFIQGGANNPTGDLYNNLINACNAELSKLILGQTETTESSASSGYAQASVHANTENDINRTDLVFVRRTLNRRVVAIMKANGINANGSFMVRQDDTPDLTLEQQLNIELRLRNEAKLPISDEHFYTKYGIEKPEDYEAQKVKLEAQAQPQFGLNDPFRNAPKADGAKIISLRDLYSDCDCGCRPGKHASVKLADTPNDNDDFIEKVFKGELKDGQIHDSYYFDVAKKLTEAVKKGLGSDSFKATDYRNTLKAHLDFNVFAFSGAKSLAVTQEYKNKLTDENGNIVSYGAFRNAVTEVEQEFNDNHLRAEYNSAIGLAQMAEKWESLQQFDYWEYRTVGDKNVRKSHEALDGKVFAKDDPVWDKIYPPNGWNCRCTVVPAAPAAKVNTYEEAKGAVADAKISPYFSRNVGKSKVMFSNNHPYFQRMTQGGLKTNELSATKNYNMKSLEQIYKTQDMPEMKPITAEQAKEWFAKNAANGKISVTAKDGISIDLDTGFYDKIVDPKKDKYTDRAVYANIAPDILKNPDEVWANVHNGQLQSCYIKYYHDAPYMVVTKVNNGKVEFESFYKIDRDGEFNQKRKGVLKYRK